MSIYGQITRWRIHLISLVRVPCPTREDKQTNLMKQEMRILDRLTHLEISPGIQPVQKEISQTILGEPA